MRQKGETTCQFIHLVLLIIILWVFIHSITSINDRVDSVTVLKKSSRTVKMSDITQANEQQETTASTRFLQTSKPFSSFHLLQ